ncbi:MAG: hypothetical protein P8Z33_00875 [Gammaproteobacteria bacterium]
MDDIALYLDAPYRWLHHFDVLPLWAFGAIFFGVMIISLEIGFRVGKKRRDTWRNAESGGGGIVQTSIFAVLGLVLAFTYSAGLTRFEARKAALLNEANALGTAFLRADMASEPGRTELMESLYEYAVTRSIPPRSSVTLKDQNVFLSKTLEKQARIWPATKRVIDQENPDPLEVSILASINNVLDAHTVRFAAVIDGLHPTIIFLLALVTLSAMAVAGFNAGIHGRMSRWRMTAFAIVLTALVFVILDLDRPNDGTIIVDQRLMNILIADMNKALHH